MDRSLCSCLITWLKTFPGHSNITALSLTNGAALGTILHQIAPEYFTDLWSSKIKADISDNWRLKVSNLRKIQQGVMDYFYFSELPAHTIHLFPTPDLNKIAEHNDEIELGRLLQLILGCAINCEEKQRHIEGIMRLDASDQTKIVEAIKDMIPIETSPEGATPPDEKSFEDQLKIMSRANHEKTQRCNELEIQIIDLNQENTTVKQENERLKEKVEALENGEDIGAHNFRYKDLRKQLETAQDQLYTVESSRDEYRNQVEVLEAENQELKARNEELPKLEVEAKFFKDEVDALQGMKDRVTVLEGSVESYKKKNKELNEIKRQFNLIQQEKEDLTQHNVELEKENKKLGTWRPQLDLYKKQVSDLLQKLDDAANKTEREKFEKEKLLERLEALTQEKERLGREKDKLKDNLDELRCSAILHPNNTSEPGSNGQDFYSSDIRERMVRLEKENSLLKQRLNDQASESVSMLQSQLEDHRERNLKLEQENRNLNRQIMVLEDKVKDNSLFKTDNEDFGKTNSDSRKVAEMEKKLAERSEKISSLEETLLRRESDMSAMEERYKKYLRKAKSVIQTLDPKHNSVLVPDTSALESQLREKEKLIENMEKESEKSKMIREAEEKLISTAFYNYGMQMHRQMISQRLSTFDNGQSFLSRQRQESSRRPMAPNVGNNSQYYHY